MKASWNTNWSNTDATNFTKWVKEIHDNMIALGFVQLGDSGQLNPSSPITPPSTSNTVVGKLLYYLADSLDATRRVIVMIEPGSNASAPASGITRPDFRMTVGFATDGASNFVGVTSDTIRANAATASGNTNTATAMFSYMCVVDGFFGLIFKTQAWSYPRSPYFFICRSTDSSGNPTADGVHVLGSNIQSTSSGIFMQAQYITPLVALPSHRSCGCMIGGDAGASAGGSVQVNEIRNITPHNVVIPQLLAYVKSSAADFTEFQATIAGQTQRNYICLGTGAYDALAGLALNANACMAMLWE